VSNENTGTGPLTDNGSAGSHTIHTASDNAGGPDTDTSGLVQLLTPDGVRVSDPDYDPWIADMTAERLASLYEDMVVVRRIDTEATALQRQGDIALWPPLLGQEAAQIGSARALRTDDFVFTSYRENAVAYCRGVDLADLVRVWRGNAASGWDPYAINMATPQIIVGAQTLHATGYALGIQNDGSDAVAVAYFGDGATSQGDVNEAMIFAATYQAPVVFFCQNNHWAISEPVELQARRNIADRPPGFGIRAFVWMAMTFLRSWPSCGSRSIVRASVAAPPSSRRSRIVWVRTRRRMIRLATAIPPNSPAGPPGIPSPAWPRCSGTSGC